METFDAGAAKPRGAARTLVLSFRARGALPAPGTTAERSLLMNTTAHDPSLTSYYVTDAFYRELVESFTDWQRDDLAIEDVAERDRCRLLLERIGRASCRERV